MLCVPIYNMKLAMMQKKTPIFTTFSAHTKMTAEQRGQDEVFGLTITTVCNNIINQHKPTISKFWDSHGIQWVVLDKRGSGKSPAL